MLTAPAVNMKFKLYPAVLGKGLRYIEVLIFIYYIEVLIGTLLHNTK